MPCAIVDVVKVHTIVPVAGIHLQSHEAWKPIVAVIPHQYVEQWQRIPGGMAKLDPFGHRHIWSRWNAFPRSSDEIPLAFLSDPFPCEDYELSRTSRRLRRSRRRIGFRERALVLGDYVLWPLRLRRGRGAR